MIFWNSIFPVTVFILRKKIMDTKVMIRTFNWVKLIFKSFCIGFRFFFFLAVFFFFILFYKAIILTSRSQWFYRLIKYFAQGSIIDASTLMLDTQFSDIDECSSSPCIHGTFKDAINYFTCSCDTGFTGILCDQGIWFY